MFLLFAALLATCQTDADRIRGLVQKLGSESLAEREEAIEELKKVGPAAAPELRKAAEDANPERSALAKRLLKRLEVLEPLSPRIRRDFPKETERLVVAAAEEWTSLFLEAESRRVPGTRLPLYSRGDLEGLATGALRGAEPWQHLCSVLHAVARRGIRSADPVLITLFEHPERDVRETLVPALKPTEAIVRRLLLLTADPREDVRRYAIETLGRLRVAEAVPELSRLAKSENGEVRRHAFGALALIRGLDAEADLVGWLKDPHPTARHAACSALNELYAQDSGPAIEKLLSDSEAIVRQEALRTLGQLRIRSSAPKVAQLLEGPDQIAALQCLKDLGAKEMAPKVAALLKNPEEKTLGLTITVLASLEPSLAIEPALRALESKDRYAPGQASTVLAYLKAKEGIPGIRKLLKHESDFVRGSAAAALAVLEAREAIPDLVQALDVDTGRGGKEVLIALGKLGAKDAEQKVRGLLKASGKWVKYGAVKCLDAWGSIKVEELESLLADTNYTESFWARQEAIAILARVRGHDAAASIRPLIQDQHPWACIAALDALARIEDWESVPEVGRLLGDLDPEVRRAAAGWLAKAGSRAGLKVFVEDSEAPYFTLNALKNPETWKRLVATPSPSEVDGTGAERIALWAKAAGLSVEEASKPKGVMARWLERTWMWTSNSGISVATALEANSRNAPYCLILEPDKIRIVSREEAHRFWRTWLQETEAKK